MNFSRFTLPFGRLALFSLTVLAACSGSGSNLGVLSASPASPDLQSKQVPDAKTAPNPSVPVVADVSSASTSTNAVSDRYVVIRGTVVSYDAVPYPHVVLQLSPAVEVAAYSSELKAARAGDIVSATGYYRSKAVFLVSSARIMRSSPAPYPTKTPLGRPAPAITQRHILTGDYLGGNFGSRTYSWTTYAPWLSLAETNALDSRGISAVGISTMAYSNPNRIGTRDPMYTTDETAYAHTCEGSRLVDHSSLMLTEPSSLTVRAKWKSTIATQMSWGHFDYVFMDDANDIYGFHGKTPCGYDARQWLSSTHSLIAAMPFRVIYSGLVSSNGVSRSIQLNDVSSGAAAEYCFLNRNNYGTSPKNRLPLWLVDEEAELAMAKQHKSFLCYTNNTTDSTNAHDLRMFAYASFLLTYDPQTSVLWEYFATPSHFHVQPETTLVAKQPLLAMPSDVSGLLTSTGVYAREYGACYVGGSLVGPCAAVVNPDATVSRAFPYRTYHHSLVLRGGSVLNGGTIDVGGPAPDSVLPPLGSAIVFQ